MTLLSFLVLALAAWRISSLLADEEGPGNVFGKFRAFVGVRYQNDPPWERYGSNVVSRGIICIWCNSVWVGVGLVGLFLLSSTVTFYATLPLALSAAAVFYEQVIRKLLENNKNA